MIYLSLIVPSLPLLITLVYIFLTTNRKSQTGTNMKIQEYL